MKKRVYSIILAIVMVFCCSTQAQAASDLPKQETGTFEKVTTDTYVLKNAQGDILLTYTENDSIALPRATYNVNWTIAANSSTYGDNQYRVGTGNVFGVDIKFSASGLSYIGFYDRGSSTYVWAANTELNRFKGTVTVNSGSALVSFAIKNASNKKITYSGSYTF